MSMRDLTIESMKLEVYWMELELKDLRAKLAASQERETVSMNSDNLCSPHKIFLNSQNLTGCVLCERNKEIEDLKAQLAASQERERILREGLKEYGNPSNWYQREDFDTDGSSLGFTWEHYWNGPCLALDTITAAEEVKG